MADRSRRELLLLEKRWRRYQRDEVSFLRECVHIKKPGVGKILFDLRPAQLEGLRHWNDNRYSLTLKARQIGWSTLVAAHAVWICLFHPDREIIFISRTEREAVELLAKAKYAYKNLPQWIRNRAPALTTDHQQRMVFANGSQIISMPSANDPARGSSAYLIVVDEWAFLPDGEAAWASIEPVADVGGRVIGLSTANGAGNFFYDLWVGAETGENYFATMFHPWSANTDRDESWYRDKARTMNSWQIAQEYPRTAEEAFVKSGRPVFSLDAIAAYIPIDPQIGELKDVVA